TQPLGQLITASLAVKLVLATICLLSLTQDLQRDLAIRAVLIHRRVRLDLRPVDRDHPDRHQTSLPAQAEHVIKQPSEIELVPAAELRNRGVIRCPLSSDHTEGDVLP